MLSNAEESIMTYLFQTRTCYLRAEKGKKSTSNVITFLYCYTWRCYEILHKMYLSNEITAVYV